MTFSAPPPGPGRPAEGIDTSRPRSARFWNYLLGGKDNYPADRDAAEEILALIPTLADSARAERGFLARAVRYLANEAGLRQFLDIGTGLPTANNTHEVAQTVAPDCRIVYVDNDPLIMVHARALLTSTPQGATDYLHADVRDPETILREAARTLDFTRPIALMLLGVLNYVVDTDQAHRVVRRLVDALPPGSYVALSHPTPVVHGATMTEAMRLWNERGGNPVVARDVDELTRFFTGLELLEPGVVSDSLWRPGPIDVGTAAPVSDFCGVARKP